jgi:hypothetical protein
MMSQQQQQQRTDNITTLSFTRVSSNNHNVSHRRRLAKRHADGPRVQHAAAMKRARSNINPQQNINPQTATQSTRLTQHPRLLQLYQRTEKSTDGVNPFNHNEAPYQRTVKDVQDSTYAVNEIMFVQRVNDEDNPYNVGIQWEGIPGLNGGQPTHTIEKTDSVRGGGAAEALCDRIWLNQQLLQVTCDKLFAASGEVYCPTRSAFSQISEESKEKAFFICAVCKTSFHPTKRRRHERQPAHKKKAARYAAC